MKVACGTTSCPIRMGKWSSWCGTDDPGKKMRHIDGPARVEIGKEEKKEMRDLPRHLSSVN